MELGPDILSGQAQHKQVNGWVLGARFLDVGLCVWHLDSTKKEVEGSSRGRLMQLSGFWSLCYLPSPDLG